MPEDSNQADIKQQFHDLLWRDMWGVLEGMRAPSGHVVLNADDLFKQWPQYAEDSLARRWLGPLLYSTAREFTDQAFRMLLEQPAQEEQVVLFTAGGGASGKSTVLRAQGSRPDVDFIVDTTFSNLAFD